MSIFNANCLESLAVYRFIPVETRWGRYSPSFLTQEFWLTILDVKSTAVMWELLQPTEGVVL